MSFIADKVVMDGLTYDDVLLIPSYSEVLPREVSMRNRIVSIFTSLENGVLTVWSKTSKYEIDCYVQEIPVITKDSNVPYVYRWNVDFIADYPFWRKGKKRVVNYTNVLQSQNINYYGEIAAPWNLTYKATGNIFICNNGHSIKINAYNGYVNIDSYTTKVTNESGQNINYIIDPTTEFDYYNLVPGKNNFVISGADTAALSFYNLAIGVI